MGIRNFIITRLSFGGISESAKVVVKIYRNIMLAHPELAQNELFKLTLKARRDHVKKLVKEPLYEQDDIIERDVKEANGSLFELIFKELKYEYPVLEEIEIDDPGLYREAVDIVKEVVEKS